MSGQSPSSVGPSGTAARSTPPSLRHLSTPVGRVSHHAHTTFHLMAVVRHIGGAEGGHYITYRRVPEVYEPPLVPPSPPRDCGSRASAVSDASSVDLASVSVSSADSSPTPPRGVRPATYDSGTLQLNAFE